MGHYNTPVDLARAFNDLKDRVAVLERTALLFPQFTTADRPAASTMKARIIFNITTNKHEASDGTSWLPLY